MKNYSPQYQIERPNHKCFKVWYEPCPQMVGSQEPARLLGKVTRELVLWHKCDWRITPEVDHGWVVTLAKFFDFPLFCKSKTHAL